MPTQGKQSFGATNDALDAAVHAPPEEPVLEEEQSCWLRFVNFCHFPLPVYFIVGNEFCERFSYYGMKSMRTARFFPFLSFLSILATGERSILFKSSINPPKC